MHPLMPDDFTFCSADTGATLEKFTLPDLAGKRGVALLARFNPADLFYSFGIAHPGAVRLHNYPKSLQHLVRDNGEQFDLGTIDILRDRERGVPRYNQFLRLLHKPPVRSFDEISDVPAWCEEIKRVYDNNLEKVARWLHDGGEAASELRLQRYRLPDFPADGLAAPQERSVPVEGLSRGDLHQAGHRLGERDADDRRDRPSLPVARRADERPRQRIQAVDSEGVVSLCCLSVEGAP